MNLKENLINFGITLMGIIILMNVSFSIGITNETHIFTLYFVFFLLYISLSTKLKRLEGK